MKDNFLANIGGLFSVGSGTFSIYTLIENSTPIFAFIGVIGGVIGTILYSIYLYEKIDIMRCEKRSKKLNKK